MNSNQEANITEDSLSIFGPTPLWEALVTEDSLSIFGPTPLWEALVTIFILGVIIIFIILGNFFVIISIFVFQPLRIVPNYLIASLATADLLVGIFVLPLDVVTIINHQWLFDLQLCKVWLTLDVTFCTTSIWNICGIALDRYQAISNPTEYRQKRTVKRTLFMILIVWMIPLIVSVPPLLGWNNWDGFESTCEYVTGVGYAFFSVTLSFYLPLTILFILCYKIARCIKEHMKSKMERLSVGPNRLSKISIVPEVAAEEEHASKRKSVLLSADSSKRGSISINPQGKRGSIILNQVNTIRLKRAYHNAEQLQRISVTRETRAARILGLIMVMFVICWLPFFVMLPVLALCPSCTPVPRLFHSICWLGYINSAVNPIIYTIFNEDFKRAFSILLNKVICHQN